MGSGRGRGHGTARTERRLKLRFRHGLGHAQGSKRGRGREHGSRFVRVESLEAHRVPVGDPLDAHPQMESGVDGGRDALGVGHGLKSHAAGSSIAIDSGVGEAGEGSGEMTGGDGG